MSSEFGQKVCQYKSAAEIARGRPPFQPETVSIQAGRLMLTRLDELLAAGETFALETTLATRHYLRFIAEAGAGAGIFRGPVLFLAQFA